METLCVSFYCMSEKMKKYKSVVTSGQAKSKIIYPQLNLLGPWFVQLGGGCIVRITLKCRVQEHNPKSPWLGFEPVLLNLVSSVLNH